MNKDAFAQRNLNLAQRVPRIISFHPFARGDVMIFDPGAVRRYPIRIENNLVSATQTAGQRKILSADSNRIRLNLFSALPKRQLKSGNVDSDVDITIARL